MGLALALLTAGAEARAEEPCGEAVEVARGETLERIAARCGVSLSALLAANPAVSDPNVIHPGQSLAIPSEEAGAAADQAGLPEEEAGSLAAEDRPVMSAAEAHETTVSDWRELDRLLDPAAMPIGRVVEAPGDDDQGAGIQFRQPREPGDGAIRITGRLIQGLECPAVHGDDGTIYSLALDEPAPFQLGDRVEVTGTPAQASFCMQGTTIEVESIQPLG